MKYDLRPATKNDCALAFRLQKLDGAEFDVTNSEHVAELEKYQAEFKPAEIQIVWIDDVPIGRLRVVREGDIYIGGMQLLPEYRGQGIGTAILQNLIQEAKEGGQTIRLEVFKNNPRAKTLYERFGFEITGENEKQIFLILEPK